MDSTEQNEQNERNENNKQNVGLGVDIVEIARIKEILRRTPSFVTHVFCDDEIAYCNSTANSAVHFSMRFAAKEAVLKAIGTGFSQGITPKNVEIKRTTTGRPFAVLTGRAMRIAQSQNIIEIPISLSYTHNDAVACAMAITNKTSPKPAKLDPMDELTKQFKEARLMLDDIESHTLKETEGSDGCPQSN